LGIIYFRALFTDTLVSNHERKNIRLNGNVCTHCSDRTIFAVSVRLCCV